MPMHHKLPPPPLPKKKNISSGFPGSLPPSTFILKWREALRVKWLAEKKKKNTKNQAGPEHGPPHYECSAPIMSSTITEGALIIYTVQRAVAPWGWVANMWSSRREGPHKKFM